MSPLFWGSLSDTLGRRPIYIYSFSVYIVSNIVLSLSPNFPVLLVFRGLQAAGSASTVSIGTSSLRHPQTPQFQVPRLTGILSGNGVIQDIATPDERGAFISFYQASMLAPLVDMPSKCHDADVLVVQSAISALPLGPLLADCWPTFSVSGKLTALDAR